MKQAEHTDRFWRDAFRRWWRQGLLLVAVPTLATIAFACLYQWLYTPQYEVTATLYVRPVTSSVASPEELDLAEKLSEDCAYLLGSPAVAEKALARAREEGLAGDLSLDELMRQTAVSQPEGTHILELTVRDPDPERGQALVQALCREGMEAAEQLVGYQPLTVYESERVATRPCNRLQLVTCGAVWVAVLMLCVAWLWVPTVLGGPKARPTESDTE